MNGAGGHNGSTYLAVTRKEGDESKVGWVERPDKSPPVSGTCGGNNEGFRRLFEGDDPTAPPPSPKRLRGSCIFVCTLGTKICSAKQRHTYLKNGGCSLLNTSSIRRREPSRV